jgi:hypothetical protein
MTMSTMTEIMSGALELPRSDRSYLASKLIESLDETEELLMHLYLFGHPTITELCAGLEKWFERYNHWRPHETHSGETPATAYAPEEPRQIVIDPQHASTPAKSLHRSTEAPAKTVVLPPARRN